MPRAFYFEISSFIFGVVVSGYNALKLSGLFVCGGLIKVMVFFVLCDGIHVHGFCY